MKTFVTMATLAAIVAIGCDRAEAPAPAAEAESQKPAAREHRSNIPPLHADNIVSIASRSEDHTTLVEALKAADYVTAVAASGPLTVFAPTDQAFAALPPGTLDRLLEPANADELREVLKYHVTTSSLSAGSLKDGQTLGMANGDKATIRVDGEEKRIEGATIVASIPATNGMVHVVDRVLLPPSEE